MPSHREQRILPYTADQLFLLVADIAKYPEFLPWCSSARIIRHEGEHVIAELVIGYKMIRERFVSRVTLDRAKHAINVQYISGPLRNLRNEWQFHTLPKKNKQPQTRVDFYVHFEFSNPILATMMNMFFDVAFRTMVTALEQRAAVLYGIFNLTEKS